MSFFVFGKVSPPAGIGSLYIKVGWHPWTPKGHPKSFFDFPTPEKLSDIDKVKK
jgi:hypothetical protein